MVDNATTHPLDNAAIRIVPPNCIQFSDNKGRFTFPRLGPGKYIVEAAYLGYQTVRDSFLVAPNAALDLEIRLDRTVIPIEPIRVVARSAFLERMGFYERRAAGNGTFLTHGEIEKMPAVSSATDILRRMNGVHLTARRGLRGNRVLGRNSCPFRYFVDGNKTDPQFEFDDLEAAWIEGLEIYTGLGQIPPEYAGTDGVGRPRTCGAIVIWTRQRR